MYAIRSYYVLGRILQSYKGLATNRSIFVSLLSDLIHLILKKKALFNWSSGKDSALTLYKTLQNPEFEINCLLTSINQKYQRISMHGVRVSYNFV